MTKTRLVAPAALNTILAGRFMSASLSTITSIFISVEAMALSGSPAAVGIFVALRMVGSAAGGALSARSRRRIGLSKLFFAADFVAALAMLFCFALPAAWSLTGLAVVTFILGASFGLSQISLLSTAPDLVGAQGRHRLNGQIQIVQSAATIGGGVILGMTSAILQMETFLLFGALIFVTSSLLTSARAPQLKIGAPQVQAAATSRCGIFKVGLPAVFICVIVARLVEAFGSGMHNVGFPVLSTSFDPSNQAQLAGWLFGAWGLGKMIAGLTIARSLAWARITDIHLPQIFVVMVVLTFAMFWMVFSVTALLAYLIFAFLAGLFDAATEVCYYSTLQGAEPVLRDRMISFGYMAERLALFSGILLAGLILEVVSLTIAASILYGAAILITVLVAFVLWRYVNLTIPDVP
ncbi:hypothetical protein BC777_1769 [Yoonia maricola]|uniref:Major facilitator superfamily (MFS) profile domain-containing protein n=1 Tax=Yoonia maricola TaxID=420999 RepID=A0A2M8WPS3_9RHOB|nr:hypothetical protein [Yoonia maricola]PJI92904.1 hypothetical protein BC777_1769 [Yoonia maricola]